MVERGWKAPADAKPTDTSSVADHRLAQPQHPAPDRRGGVRPGLYLGPDPAGNTLNPPFLYDRTKPPQLALILSDQHRRRQ